MASVEPETLKACSSRRRRRQGVLNGERYSLPSRLGGLGKRRKLPLRGPGQKNPGEKRFYMLSKRLRTPLVATFVEN